MATAPRLNASPQFNMPFVWRVCLAASLGGLMFGYDWVVISGGKEFYERYFNVQTAWDEGWAMASALVGCLVGAVLSGTLSDRFGRKRLLILAATVFVVSSIGTGLVDTFAAFNLWRIAGGLAIGLASNLSPMYIAEIAPAAVRGRLVAMNQFAIVSGVLLAQAANYAINEGGTHLDAARVADAQAVALDGDKIGRELAWQLPLEEREPFLEKFRQAIRLRGKLADLKPVEKVVEEINAAQQRLEAEAKAEGPGTRKKRELSRDVKVDLVPAKVAGLGFEQTSVTVGWRWMFGITALPACLFFLLMFTVPESPRWLVKYGHSAAAREVLARIGGEDFARDEVASIEATLVGEIETVRFGDLFERRMLAVLGIGVALAVLQQWCGINVILYYAADMFKDAGYDVSAALLNIVILGAVNMAFTIVAINTVDRWGRRILMLLGYAGLTVTHTLIGWGYVAQHGGGSILAWTLAALGLYGLTLAPITWVVLSEIFPNRIRGAAMAVSVSALWIADFLLTLTFPPLRKALGTGYTFWIYAAICAVGLVFVLACLPETKGKSLEQIERELVD